jgi:hypothetical protein
MKITKKMVEVCRKAGACDTGLHWIETKPRTINQLYAFDKNWFFWLINILSKPASDAYDAAIKPASDAYDAAIKSASDAYDAAIKSASDAYNAAIKPARDAYNAAIKPARDAYNAAIKPARDAYDTAVKTALIKSLEMDGWK